MLDCLHVLEYGSNQQVIVILVLNALSIIDRVLTE